MAEHSKNDRRYFERRKAVMKTERSSFIPHYKELSEFVQPRRGRFFTADRNKGDKRHKFIINSHASWAHRTAKTGLFAGTMNPARPWFRLATDDRALMEFGPVKVWLGQVEQIMRDVFERSNLYTMAPTLFGELVLFGTGCMLHVDDFQDVARFYTLTAGSYMISQNSRQQINTLVREYEQTTEQLMTQFGRDAVSTIVKNQWDDGVYDKWHPVTHFIEPNPDFDPRRLGSRFKAFRSIKYQPGNALENQFLSRRGFDRFPAYCPRWETTGEDVYGTDCPAMTALGDIKQLQTEEKRKAQGIAKQVNPALKGPPGLPAAKVNSLPGGYTEVTGNPGQEKLSTIYDVNLSLQDLMADLAKIESRIDQGFFVDLFQAISNMEGVQPRNQLELTQVKEESLVQLGPALGRVHHDWLEGMVDRTFEQLVDADAGTFTVLPPPPPELEGLELKVEFISSLAQAQNAIATGNIDRLAAYVTGLSATPGYEQVTDKFDADQSVDEYGHLIGAPARLVVPDELVAERRQARAEAEQAARQQEMQMELAKAAAGPAAGVAGTDLSQDNLVSRATNAIAGNQ